MNNLKHFTIGLSLALVLLLFTLSQHYVRAENAAIKGTIVDDANCTVERINEVNSKHFYDKVSKLVTKTFFKIFKVDLASECPFWAMKVMCGTEGGCSVCKCDEKEIPIPWKITTQNKVNTFLGASLGNQRWVDDNKNVWFPKPLEESKMTYVNLLMNPESNTGYSGSEAARVWKAIYTENCFKEGNLPDMCFEERVFFRLMSGLHTSITLKIATYFHKRIPIPTDPHAEPASKQSTASNDQAISTTNGQIIHPEDYFSPNLDFYKYRIAPFQDRLKNLYFLYTFTLRAIQKAEKVLRNYDYNTGNEAEDKETKVLVHQLLDTTGVCDPTFDESLLFRSSEKSFLREQMRNHFRNISAIMDCVACEKCRMWAKLEMLGLATAFKIVLADDKSSYQNLQRNEIIALINSFNQLSRSINDLDRLNNMLWRKEMAPYVAYTMTGVISLAVLRFLWIVVSSKRRAADEKKKKQ